MIYDTPEMLASTMDRQQHRAKSLFSMFGSKAGSNDILVIDLSYWQDHTRIDYGLLADNINGVILRATYGTAKDTRFDIHYDNFYKRKVPVGGYAYPIGSQPPEDQAKAFHKAVGGRELKLSVYPDIEDRRAGTAINRSISDRFIFAVDSLFATTSRIYTGPYAWREIMGDNYTIHSHRKLWIGNYMTNQPMLPIGGGWKTWWLWQYTDRERLPGYNSQLDASRYNGTKEEFYKEIQVGYTPPTEDTMYIVEMLGNLHIRVKPDANANPTGAYALIGKTYYATERSANNWYKIEGGWVSGNTEYTRITATETDPVEVPGEELTLENLDLRIARIEKKLGL